MEKRGFSGEAERSFEKMQPIKEIPSELERKQKIRFLKKVLTLCGRNT